MRASMLSIVLAGFFAASVSPGFAASGAIAPINNAAAGVCRPAACIPPLVLAQRHPRNQDQPQPQPQPQTRPGPATCAPSGFAWLTRNCTANVGNCQYMPDSCPSGWCCP